MAFVFKEKRDPLPVRPPSALGPGEYLPVTEIKKFKSNFDTPFESKAKRLNSAINFNPGPGTYYKDDFINKLQKVVSKAQIISKNQDEIITQEPIPPLYDIETVAKTRYNFNQNKEKLGFEVKEKRFKPKHNDNPGPCDYFKQRPISAFPNTNIKNKLIHLPQGTPSKFGNNNIPSIPYKNENGFEIGENGELYKLVNPSEFIHFTGEGVNCVGPGAYQIDDPEKWHKPGPSWSKMKVERDIVSGHSKNKDNINNNNGDISTRPGTAFDIRIASATSKKHKTYNMSRVASAQRDKRKENIKIAAKDKFKTQQCKDNSSEYFEEFLTFIHKQNPGPGYYSDLERLSAFNSTPYPESRQFFGSNNERFIPEKNNINLGPATYFKHIHDIPDKITNFTPKPSAPFSTRAKRFNINNKEKHQNSFPGPGSYNPKLLSEIEKNHFNNTLSNFTLRQKRFDERQGNLKWQMETPGPGAYINPYAATGTSNTMMINGIYIESQKAKKILRPRSSAAKVLKVNRDIMPDMGTYDPQKVFSIEYNAKKNKFKAIGGKVAFNTHIKKEKKKAKSNIGPGKYYKEKPVGKEQINPPFHQSDVRFQNINTYEIGPGTYDSRSYFDWNKKTYNLSFI